MPEGEENDHLSTVIEVKLCDKPVHEKRIVKIIFVVYDSEGVIRDEDSFKKEIQKNPGVHVIVVKH